jgi:hypothetical protein
MLISRKGENKDLSIDSNRDISFKKYPFGIKLIRALVIIVTPVRYQILIRFRFEISMQFLTQVTI